MPGGQKEAYELVAPILRKLLRVLKMVNHVSPISVLTVRVTMSKWFTTVSNMATCS
jgi:hypothetical protein